MRFGAKPHKKAFGQTNPKAFIISKSIFVQRKVLGNEEFPNWNPQTEFTSVEENSLVMTFASESGFATMLSYMVNSFKAF